MMEKGPQSRTRITGLKTSIMKPQNNLLLIGLFFALLPVAGQAQYALGGGLDYNVDVKRAGIFLRGTYVVDTLWRAAGTFNLFFENGSKATRWELAADAHYFFWGDDKRRSYLIGGLNLFHEHFATAAGETESPPPVRRNLIGLNLGAGIETQLSPHVFPFAEVKVSVGDGSLFGIHAGLLYRFR